MSDPPPIVDYDKFLSLHQSQLNTINFPSSLYESLYKKLHYQIFDAGNNYTFIHNNNINNNTTFNNIRKYELTSNDDIKINEDIWLIDHVFSTTYDNIKQIRNNPNLIDRLMNIMDGSHKFYIQIKILENIFPDVSKSNLEKSYISNNEDLINTIDELTGKGSIPEINDSDLKPEDYIMEIFWKYAWYYRVMEKNDIQTIWYILDEVGSSIKVSSLEDANVACYSFVCLTLDSMAFNIMWPIKDIQKGDIIKRYMPLSCNNETEKLVHSFHSGCYNTEELISRFNSPIGSHTPSNFSLSDGLSGQDYAQRVKSNALLTFEKEMKSVLKVFTDLAVLSTALDPEWFLLVDDINEADIVWYSHLDFKDFDSLRPDQFINKFKHEANITYKHFLSQTLERYYGNVSWKPTTYNSKTQLLQFFGDYLNREKNNLDNTWITKSTNSTHSVGHVVTRNLDLIMSMNSAFPVIIQKYIERPLLFNKRKFDLRFIVLVKSIEPLEVYVYNTFWIRLANKEFALNSFDEYEQHFTVMNYTGFQLTQIWYYDFIAQLEAEHSNLKFPDILKKIHAMIKDVFVSVSQPPPNGFDQDKRSRAMYGFDVMINDDHEPVILEANFSPDCTRAVKYHANYFNHVFSALFHDQISQEALYMMTKL